MWVTEMTLAIKKFFQDHPHSYSVSWVDRSLTNFSSQNKIQFYIFIIHWAHSSLCRNFLFFSLRCIVNMHLCNQWSLCDRVWPDFRVIMQTSLKMHFVRTCTNHLHLPRKKYRRGCDNRFSYDSFSKYMSSF